MEADPLRVLTVTRTDILEGLKDAGNRTVWQQYVDRYRPLLVAWFRRLGLAETDAEDVAQETLLAFSTAYREGRYDREQGRLRSWLFGIARNQFRAFRRRRREVRLDTDDAEDVADPTDLEGVFEEEWQDAVLRQGLETVRQEVEPRTFEAFDLFVHQAWPARRVAEHLGMTEDAVFAAKHRLLRRLRDLLPRLESDW